MKKNMLVLCVGLLAVCLLAATGSFAGEEKKITGTIAAGSADPAGKMATIVIQCEDGNYQVVANDVAKRMEKAVGSKADVTGMVDEVAGQKVITPWLFERLGGKKHTQPTS